MSLKRLECDEAFKELKACSCHHDIKAITARLEAAEHCVVGCSENHRLSPHQISIIMAWRKAAGK